MGGEAHQQQSSGTQGGQQLGECDSSRESSDGALEIPASTQRALEEISNFLQGEDEFPDTVRTAHQRNESPSDDPRVEARGTRLAVGSGSPLRRSSSTESSRSNNSPRQHHGHDDVDEDFFSGLYTQIDAVLQTGKMKGRFAQVSIPDENPLRHMHSQHHSSYSIGADEPAEASRFEVELMKVGLEQRFGFQCTPPKAGGDILVVTDIEPGSLLDMWNRRARQRGEPCVQRFSVVQSVNGVEGDHILMRAELKHNSIKMVVVNPPTVQDMVILCDAVRRPRAHPKPFWHSPSGDSISKDSSPDAAEFQEAFRVRRAGVSSVAKPMSMTSLSDSQRRDRKCSKTYEKSDGDCKDPDCQPSPDCRNYAGALCSLNLGATFQKN